MELRILGPLEVVDGDRPVPVNGARQRALLCVLLLHAGEVVSADRLLDEVWGDDHPASGLAALQMRVTQLRRALAGGPDVPAVVTRPGGYELRVGADDVDAWRFERLLTEGRALAAEANPAAAATCLRAALALWRGPPLADFAYEPFAQAEINRLDELRLVAYEERVEADLALDRAEIVVPEIEALVAAHPLRERLRALLMVALYRCGRQAEALSVYRDFRRLLSRELGVEPGPALQLLERQVLEQAPDLGSPGFPQTGGGRESDPPTASRKPLTVVCTAVDIAAEAAQDVDPERRGRALNRCLSVTAATFEEHGARVARLPHALLAAFGVPVVREDDALRAVRSALAAHDRLRALAPELRDEHDLRVVARSAVATGDVLATHDAEMDLLAIGGPAASALSLTSAARPDEVLAADSTEPLVRHATAMTRARQGHVAAWRVRSVSAEVGGHVVRRDSPFVGRQAALAELADALERVVAGRRVVTCAVVGAAGIGKSRLAQEFTESLRDRAVVVTGACSQYGEAGTLGPLRQIVEQVARGRPLPAAMGDAEHADLVARLVAAAVGMGEASTGGDVFWAVGRFLEAQTATGPLVVVLEDLHWGAPSLLALVEFLAAWPRPARLLLLCLMRPELLQEQPRLADLLRSACVDLQPLDQDESDAMLQHLTAQRPLPARARARIRDAAEGNPLFLEQLLAMLTDRPGPNPAVGLPPTITALLAARLDRLGPGERAVLERAAVAGRVFHRDVVAALLPVQARPTVDRHLAGLVARDLLAASAPHEVAATHAFRHGLVQSAVYSGTPIETRATLHESVAQLLDQDGTGQDELVGHHLAEAHRSRVELGIRNNHTTALARAAARRLRTAGAQAHSRGDMPTAAALLDRARNLGEDDDVEALEILPDLGYALFEVGELTRAEQVLLDAERRTGAAGAHGLRWRATVTRLHLGIYLSPSAVDIDPMVREAAEAETFLAAAGDDVGLARALMLRSDLDFMRGRSGAALAAMRRGLRHARRAGARREEAWCMGQLGFALMAGETPVDRGLAQCARTLRETVGNPVARANLLPFLAVHEAMRGDFASARVHAAEGRTATRELGLRWQDGIHLLLSGYVELWAGDPVMAEWHLREAAQSFAEVGDEWFARTAAVDLSRALLEQGRPDDARGAIGTAATDLPDAELQIKHRSLLAVLMAQETPSEAAVDCAREAVQIAETTDLVTWHAAAQLDLAEVLSRCGDRSGAADAGEAARLLFARKGHVAGERRAQQRLTSLVPTGA